MDEKIKVKLLKNAVNIILLLAICIINGCFDFLSWEFHFERILTAVFWVKTGAKFATLICAKEILPLVISSTYFSASFLLDCLLNFLGRNTVCLGRGEVRDAYMGKSRPCNVEKLLRTKTWCSDSGGDSSEPAPVLNKPCFSISPSAVCLLPLPRFLQFPQQEETSVW